jgi:hypothetical protein
LLGDDELAKLLAEAAVLPDLGRGPMPAVLDTDFVRRGLHYQLNRGEPPASVSMAQTGELRLFMEYDTLTETGARLPRFARQLGAPVSDLRRMFNDWLPYVGVVQLPGPLREVDPRARAVRDLDCEDFPAAALAALLSPCLLLTHNYKHFAVLGVRSADQGRDGVLAIADIKIGETRVQAVVLIPATPARAAGAAVQWVNNRIGPGAWVLLGLLVLGGVYWYRKQPPERRDRIKATAKTATEAAVTIGGHLLNEYTAAAATVTGARVRLQASMIPQLEQRTPASAILRELALADESLSAAQLAELVDPSVRPPVADLRAFLREHDTTVFSQVRRGGFVLGRHYRLGPAG